MVKLNLVNMAKMAAKTVQSKATKHIPEISAGIGIVLMGSAVVLGIEKTPTAVKLMEERKEELEVEELDKVEIVKTTWKCYIPCAVSFGIGAACIVGANVTSAKRSMALATAYALSESSLKEYKDKVVETFGEKKEKKVRDSIAKDKLDGIDTAKEIIVKTGKGTTLCYDLFSGRLFESDIEAIKKAVNEVNRIALLDGYASLNEFYDQLGLRTTKQGEDFGWNPNHALLEIDFSSQLTDDGHPALVLDYVNYPQLNYNYGEWL